LRLSSMYLESGEKVSLEKNIQDVELEFRKLGSKLRGYEETHVLAGDMINAIRDASLAVVMRKIGDISPLLNKIYWRINPHPSFSEVAFNSSLYYGKGQMTIQVADVLHQESIVRDPEVIFSSSQLNALAVSIFLSFNIGTDFAKLPLTILDDPLQSLDELNLLGLVDVLRRLKLNRQLIVTTHESRLKLLLSNKLRPTKPGEAVILCSFTNWTRKGPELTVSRIEGQETKFKVVQEVA